MLRAALILLLTLPAWGAYSNCKSITIPQKSSTLTDFMVTFRGTYSWLATTANGGNLQNASGYDVDFFSDSGCTTAIPWERVSHNLTTGAVEFHVQKTLSSSAATVIYVGTGDSGVTTDQSDGTGAWPSAFKGVWHLKEDPSGSAPQMADSTASAGHLTSVGTMTTGDLVAAQNGNGIDLDGTDDRLQADDSAALSVTGDLTVSVWFKMANNPPSAREGLITKWANFSGYTDKRSYALGIDQSTGRLSGLISSSGGYSDDVVSNLVTGTVDRADGAWHHAVLVFVPSTSLTIYVDGAQEATQTTSIRPSIYDGTARLWIGSQQTEESIYNAQAIVDEGRVVAAARSADWIAAEYANQSDPATFYEVEGETLPTLSGLSNAVMYHEASGSAQTSQPRTLYRSFAQGEFASGTYPKPRVDGTAPSAWQVDVATTWPDGSVRAAYISFRLSLSASGYATVDFVSDENPCHLGNLATCQAAALDQAAMLAYDTGGGANSWSATWEGTVNSITYTAAARTMMAAGAWRWRLRGPVASGVIVEDRTSALAYDFGWKYVTDHWEAPGTDSYKSLHPVFEIRFYPDPDGAGALTAWGGVEVDAQIWNATLGRFQRFNDIALVLKTGASEATTAYSVTGAHLEARMRRHKLVWSGTAPAAVVADYNFRYVIHTKLIPPYDYNLAVANTLADSQITTYDAELGSDEPQWCSDTSHCGNWIKAVGTTGARGEIALLPRWYATYLYLMGNASTSTATKKSVWDKLVIGNADAGGNIPLHYMDPSAGRTFYDTYDSTTAAGKFLSIDATESTNIQFWGTNEQTYFAALCAASPCDGRGSGGAPTSTNNWSIAGATNYTSHAPLINALPAFLTGYDYYLRGAQFEAAYTLAAQTGGSYGSNSGVRMNSWGIIYWEQVFRGTAWGLRNIMWGYLLTPDSEAIEKAYFLAKLKNNVRYAEGVYLLTDGAYPPADASCASFTCTSSGTCDGAVLNASFDLWCAGRNWWSSGMGGPGIPATNPLYIPVYGSAQNSTTDGWVAGSLAAPQYWQSYVASVWSWIAETGAALDADDEPIFTHLRDAAAAYYAGRVLYSPLSMYMLRDIEAPVSGDATIPDNWTDHLSGIVTSHLLDSDMTDSQTTIDLTDKDTGASDRGDTWLNTSWVKVDSEYMRLSGVYSNDTPSSGKSRLTISQRGDWGSVAAAHTAGATVTWIPGFWHTYTYEYQGGYPVLARAALAMLANATQLGDYSPIAAYQMYQAALPYQHYTTNPMWAFVPRESISSVTATGGTGTASLSWLAPSGAACNVYLGTSAPSSSQDGDGETVDTSLGRRQSVAATGLAAGTWHYRITCGTARTSGTVEVE